MIAIGAGGLDVAVCMAGHPFELPCPKIVGVFLENELQRPWIQAKDVILELLTTARRARRSRRDLRVHRARRLDAQLHRARDDREHDRGAGRDRRGLPGGRRDADAGSTSRSAPSDFVGARDRRRRGDFDEDEHIDLAALVPLVAKPSSPGNVVPVDELVGTPLAQVCIGSSVNSSYEDHGGRSASTLRGSRISEKLDLRDGDSRLAPDPRPDHAVRDLRRPADWRACGCSSRPAGRASGMGQAPPSGANSLRTFNRNFPGRSGTADDSVYLCSPAVAAASMLTGEISDPARADCARAAGAPAGAARGRPGAHPRAGACRRGGVDRDPARAEHQAAAGAEGAAGRRSSCAS